MSNLTVSLSPHVRAQSSTRRIMLDVLIALIPAVVFAVYWFGFSVLVTILLSMAAAIGSEALMQKALPAGVPWYVPVLGAAFAIVIAKQVFGGLGDNFVNPALAGRAFLLASFPVAMTTFPAVADAVSSATPLSSEFAGTVDYAQAFLGRIGGSIGEVSKLALLAGAANLLVRRVIDWRVPVSYLGTLAVLNLAFGEPVLDSVLLGGTVLGAFFMATDYVTSPVPAWGKVLYGIGIGAINFAIRQWGAPIPRA